MDPRILIPIFFVIVVIGGFLSWRASVKRVEALRLWARSKGLRFRRGRDHQFDDRYPMFDQFREGSNRYAYNQCTGNWDGRDLTTFDFHYETHSRDSKGRRTTHHHHFSGILLEPHIRLEPLVIRPEGIFDKLSQFLGFDDIDFESAEFSRKYYVKSKNRKWAYDVIHQRCIDFLLSKPRLPIQFSNRHVLVLCSGRSDVRGLETALEIATGILDRLPEYVKRQQQDRIESRGA